MGWTKIKLLPIYSETFLGHTKSEIIRTSGWKTLAKAGGAQTGGIYHGGSTMGDLRMEVASLSNVF